MTGKYTSHHFFNNQANQRYNSQIKISAVILAAGKSQRFGAPKVLQYFNKVLFLVRVVNSLRLSGIQSIHLVLGYEAEKMIPQLPQIENLHIVINENYEYGQFSSLQAGIRNLSTKSSGCLLSLIDQPHILHDSVQKIVIESSAHPEKIIIPTFENRGGHPVYIPKILFAELISSKPIRSLRDIFSDNSHLIHRLEIDDSLITEDIDTRHDLDKIEKLTNIQ